MASDCLAFGDCQEFYFFTNSVKINERTQYRKARKLYHHPNLMALLWLMRLLKRWPFISPHSEPGYNILWSRPCVSSYSAVSNVRLVFGRNKNLSIAKWHFNGLYTGRMIKEATLTANFHKSRPLFCNKKRCAHRQASSNLVSTAVKQCISSMFHYERPWRCPLLWWANCHVNKYFAMSL